MTQVYLLNECKMLLIASGALKNSIRNVHQCKPIGPPLHADDVGVIPFAYGEAMMFENVSLYSENAFLNDVLFNL